MFLSSHLLGEVEQVCDEVAIVAGGRTVTQGSVAEVLASARPAAMWVKVADLVGGAGHTAAGRAPPRRRTVTASASDVVAERAEWITRALVADGSLPERAAPGRDQSRGRVLRPHRPDHGEARG